MIPRQQRSTLFPYTTLFRSQYERATKIISENRDTLVRLAEALLEHESLDGVQIRRVTRVRAELQRSEEHTSELQSLTNLVCRLLLEKKKKKKKNKSEQIYTI